MTKISAVNEYHINQLQFKHTKTETTRRLELNRYSYTHMCRDRNFEKIDGRLLVKHIYLHFIAHNSLISHTHTHEHRTLQSEEQKPTLDILLDEATHQYVTRKKCLKRLNVQDGKYKYESQKLLILQLLEHFLWERIGGPSNQC